MYYDGGMFRVVADVALWLLCCYCGVGIVLCWRIVGCAGCVICGIVVMCRYVCICVAYCVGWHGSIRCGIGDRHAVGGVVLLFIVEGIDDVDGGGDAGMVRRVAVDGSRRCGVSVSVVIVCVV